MKRRKEGKKRGRERGKEEVEVRHIISPPLLPFPLSLSQHPCGGGEGGIWGEGTHTPPLPLSPKLLFLIYLYSEEAKKVGKGELRGFGEEVHNHTVIPLFPNR